MKRLILAAAILALTACTTAKQDDGYGAGFAVVNESTWHINNDTPYPFATSGELACSDHVEFGRGVFFAPMGFTDESYVGTPLNKAAANIINVSGIAPNVPYSVKEGANLDGAIEVGLRVCDEQREELRKNSST